MGSDTAGMDGYTAAPEVEETPEEAAARWAAYNAETDRMIRALKLSQPMKDALSLWISQSKNNTVMLAEPPVKPVTMAALESRGLVKAFKGPRWKLSRPDMETGADGARIARRIATLDGSIVAAQAAAAADRVKAAQARREAQVAEMLAPLPTEVAQAAREADNPVINDPKAAAMWAARGGEGSGGITPRSLAQAIVGGQQIIPAWVYVTEVVRSCPSGVRLAERILRGELKSVTPHAMWMLDETADAVDVVYAGIALGQMERAWDAAQREQEQRAQDAHWADIAAADELIRQGAEIDTWERPGDAERAFDAENARLEGAQVEAEQRAEVEFEEMLARLGMDMGDYTECQDQLAMERAGCGSCGADHVNAFVPCPDHASVEAWVAHLSTAPVMRLNMTVSDPMPAPVKLAMEGLPFLLVLASDRSAVVFVNTILVDKFGEEFTVMGARVSDAGTRVLIGRYASGGVGVAPYMRFPGLAWVTAPNVPWRPAAHGENRPLAPVAGVTTASPWKASSGKRSKISGGKRGWRK